MGKGGRVGGGGVDDKVMLLQIIICFLVYDVD